MSGSSDTAVLRIEGLSLAFGAHQVFSDFSWTLKPGVSLVSGGEGRGKTSLLRILAGEQRFDGGTVRLKDIDPGLGAPAYSREVFWADPRSEAHHAIAASAWLASLTPRYPRFDEALCAHLCEGLDLAEHLAKPLYMLSTGSRRKVWLAGALASGATLTLIDEPFAALDTRSIRFLREFLEEAAGHVRRAWLLADYEAPAGLALSGLRHLGD